MTFPPLGEKGGNLYLIEPKAGAQVSPGPLGILAGCYFQEGLPLIGKLEQNLQKLQMEREPWGHSV